MEGEENDLYFSVHWVPHSVAVLRALLLHHDCLQNQVLRILPHPDRHWTQLSLQHAHFQAKTEKADQAAALDLRHRAIGVGWYMRGLPDWPVRHALRFLPLLASQRDPNLAADNPVAALHPVQHASKKCVHWPEALQDSRDFRPHHFHRGLHQSARLHNKRLPRLKFYAVCATVLTVLAVRFNFACTKRIGRALVACGLSPL